MKTIKGNLIMEKDMTFNEDLKVEGNISGKGGERFNLKVIGDLDCRNLDCNNLNCWDLNCWDLNCNNLNCHNLDCWNLDCWNLNCLNLNCKDLTFYAIAIAYNSFKCRTWKARRENYVIKCLDGRVKGEKICH